MQGSRTGLHSLRTGKGKYRCHSWVSNDLPAIIEAAHLVLTEKKITNRKVWAARKKKAKKKKILKNEKDKSSAATSYWSKISFRHSQMYCVPHYTSSLAKNLLSYRNEGYLSIIVKSKEALLLIIKRLK